MARDDEIKAIVEAGRRTRKPTPRGLWIAAAIVGVVCATGFAIGMLSDRAPTSGSLRRDTAAQADRASDRGSGLRSGLVTGLVIGVVIGIAIGLGITRQRSHSSRNTP
jgi:hypothetical protein